MLLKLNGEGDKAKIRLENPVLVGDKKFKIGLVAFHYNFKKVEFINFKTLGRIKFKQKSCEIEYKLPKGCYSLQNINKIFATHLNRFVAKLKNEFGGNWYNMYFKIESENKKVRILTNLNFHMDINLCQSLGFKFVDNFSNDTLEGLMDDEYDAEQAVITNTFCGNCLIAELHCSIVEASVCPHETNQHVHSEEELLYILCCKKDEYIDRPFQILYVPLEKRFKVIQEINVTILNNYDTEMFKNFTVYLHLTT